MSYLEPSTSLQSTEKCESQGRSHHVASIDILDDDSLLHIFYLYRPFLLGEDKDDETHLFGGAEGWARGHWWFKLSHVCQRWRNLILASSSYLGLCLVCTKGTPVADMLAHSPALPLVVDYYYEDSNINAEDEERLILALGQRDRVRRIRLKIYMPDLQRLIMVITGEYPILEYLIIFSPDMPPGLALPETLQAPHLHHLMLSGIVLPIESRLLTTAVGLVRLALVMTIPSTDFFPNTLLQWISFMPQLETLVINFSDPTRTIERQQLPLMPAITPTTLPNLRWFWFHGVNADLEAIVCRMATPRLEKLDVVFFEQPTFSVPHLLQFMNTAKNLRFSDAWFGFSGTQVDLVMFPHEEADRLQYLQIRILCLHFDLQVSTMTQFSNSLSQMFPAVEHLVLEYDVHSQSSEEHNVVDRIEWRKFLRPFRNVKTLRIDDGLDEEIARCLQLDDGKLPLDLLPELHELTYSRNSDTDDEFARLIITR